MSKNPKPRSQKPSEEENNRLAGGAIGGAILGASLGGPIGAAVGGVLGLIFAEQVNKENKKAGKK